MLGVRVARNPKAPSIRPNGDSGASKIESMTLHRGRSARTPLGAHRIWRDVLEQAFVRLAQDRTSDAGAAT